MNAALRAAWLCIVLLLAGCAPVAPSVQPESPPAAAAPSTWGFSPLTLAVRPAAQRYRVALPLVSRGGWTLHGVAANAPGDWRAQEAAAESLETSLWHIWWWGPGVRGLPACRGLAECRRLFAGQVAAHSQHSFVLIGNEPNNPDTAGGGWPERPEDVAAYLRERAGGFRAEGKQIVCCNVYIGPGDATAEAWWARFAAAGGPAFVDVCSYHVFGLTAVDARRAKARGDRLCGAMPRAITEAGWNRAVSDFVQAIDEPQTVFALRLWSAVQSQ